MQIAIPWFSKPPLRGRTFFIIRSLPSFKMNANNCLDYFVTKNRYDETSLEYHHAWNNVDQTGIEEFVGHEEKKPIQLEVYYLADLTSPEKISRELAKIGIITDKILSDKKFRWFG